MVWSDQIIQKGEKLQDLMRKVKLKFIGGKALDVNKGRSVKIVIDRHVVAFKLM